MDATLDDLLAQLEEAQAAAPKPRLSERNVVDLIATLQARGYLSLVSTADGRGYVTRARLAVDLAGAVAEAGGRAALVDLPAALNVDLAHVQAVAEAVLDEGHDRLARVGGDLVAPSYWAGLAAEVAALVADGAASPSLGDLAGRFGLGVDALVAGLAPFLDGPGGDGTVPAKVEGGRLVAPAAVARARAALRGALRGAAAPVSLASFAVDSAVPLSRLVEDLVGAGAVAGRLRPGGLWVPAAHEAAAAAGLAAAFSENGYVEYSRVGGAADRRAAIAHLEATFPGGIALSAVYAGPAVFAAVDAAAEAGVASAGAWADVHAAAPPALTRADTASLMARSASVARITRGNGVVLAGTCVVSASLVADVAAKSTDLARAAAADAPTKVGAARPPPPPDSDDDGPGRRNKGGRKAGKGGRGVPATPCPPALTLRALTARVAAWVPGSAKAGGGGGDDGDVDDDEPTSLAAALAAHVRPAALAEFERALQDAVSAGAGERRRAREAAAAAAAAAADRLQLYARGADVIVKAAAEADRGGLSQVLNRHLARGPGGEAVDGWLAVLAVDAGVVGASAPPSSSTPAQRAAAVAPGSKVIPADALPAAAAAVAALAASSPSPATILDALDALAAAAGGRLRRLDKKGEKALLATVKAGLADAVAAATDPASALPPAAALAFARAHGRAASVPGRALGALVSSLDGAAPADEVAILREFHGLTVASLKGEKGGDARLAELLPAVVGMTADVT